MRDEAVRRDPRQEHIIRNRLHPEHAALMAQLSGPELGPTGLVRRNPRNVGFIGPNGIRRIDRSAGETGGAFGVGKSSVTTSREPELPLHQVIDPEFFIAVVPDMVGGRLSDHDKDMLGLAHQLASNQGKKGAVLAIVFGEHKETGFDKAGVDRLLEIPDSDFAGFSPEKRFSALKQVTDIYTPDTWLFADSILGSGDTGRRFAASSGLRIAGGVIAVGEDQSLQCQASAGTQEVTRTSEKVLLVLPECADQVSETRHEALPLSLEHPTLSVNRIQDCGQIAVDPKSIPLAEAEFILSGGNGVKDWDLFHQTAENLRATEGASRVAVDDGFMPRATQVGATGTWVSARVYIAVGISGAIQHLQGIGQCEKVIAINTDISCDMIKRASLSVIADSSAVMEAINRELGKEGQEVLDHAV
ncbi:electron transfer flavoprotein subunit alpha/FixB family protein [Parasalinivibrio latis]|uniref:electron transfer flavoprotein subunit alpha/FixB family protein n=1 Tax=Parasalinivibrio latis TaxID=2952610 RepID=UPI0030E41871